MNPFTTPSSVSFLSSFNFDRNFTDSNTLITYELAPSESRELSTAIGRCHHEVAVYLCFSSHNSAIVLALLTDFEIAAYFRRLPPSYSQCRLLMLLAPLSH